MGWKKEEEKRKRKGVREIDFLSAAKEAPQDSYIIPVLDTGFHH